ncbi:MAG: Holliday junction branch migration protein RuvA [Gammaproteobacteria bacterium]
MIGQLRGTLIRKIPPVVLLDVNGVGYEVEVSMTTLFELPELGAAVTLHTHLLVREDAHLLYGFATLEERSLFRSLIKVSGIGAKLALLILSGMSVGHFARCVHEGDAPALSRLPGIGKKTAERIIIEMRDRLKQLDSDTGTFSPAGDTGALATPVSALDDAISALIALGYKPQDATTMAKRVNTEGLASEEIIRQALKTAVSSKK